MEEFKKIVNFLFELAVLERTPRNGWKRIGIENPNSVAEHVFLASQIAYILGKMEGVNGERAALIALFHDNGEARLGDADLVTKVYLDTDQAEKKVFFDQIDSLPGREDIKKLYQEWGKQETPEAIAAKDADLLEVAIQARCRSNLGNKLTKIWIEDKKSGLKTESGKKLMEIIEKTDIDEWWQAIPEIKKKLEKLPAKK